MVPTRQDLCSGAQPFSTHGYDLLQDSLLHTHKEQMSIFLSWFQRWACHCWDRRDSRDQVFDINMESKMRFTPLHFPADFRPSSLQD